jgi:hypothetical protein
MFCRLLHVGHPFPIDYLPPAAMLGP